MMQYYLKLENTENSLDVQAEKIGWINYNTYTQCSMLVFENS